MKSAKIILEIGPPPDYFSRQECVIWENTRERIAEDLPVDAISQKTLQDITFWEVKKKILELNLVGDLSEHQQELVGTQRVSFSSHVLLSNYKSVLDELNELRIQCGFEPETPHYISNTPTIPEVVYQNLPEKLKKCCNSIPGNRKKDTFLISSLPVLSYHLNDIYVQHAIGEFSTSLKCYLVNPHGVFNRYVRKALDFSEIIRNKILLESGSNQIRLLSLSTRDEKIQESLYNNNGRILIFDQNVGNISDSKLIGNVIFSDIIEDSFNEQTIRISKYNDKSRVLKPSANTVFCGDLNGLKKLAELYSEQHLTNYFFYLFDDKSDWESVKPDKWSEELSADIEEVSSELFRLYMMRKNIGRKLQVKLEDAHWVMIDDMFKEKKALLNESGVSQSLNKMLINASIYCLKLVSTFRLLRAAEELEDISNENYILARDEDIIAALWLIDTHIKHAFRIYQNLPVMLNEYSRGDRYDRFYNLLPVLFSTSEALSIASRMNIPKRTANRYLTNYYEKNILKKLKKGVFYKER